MINLKDFEFSVKENYKFQNEYKNGDELGCGRYGMYKKNTE